MGEIMEMLKLIVLNVGVIAIVAYITHLAIKSAKHKSKHKHV